MTQSSVTLARARSIASRRAAVGLMVLALVVGVLHAPAAHAAPGDLSLSPTSLDFGDVPVGTTSMAQDVIVTNTTGAPITLSSVAGGGAGEFGGATNCVGATLAPGGTCFFQYAFTPTGVGPVTFATTIELNGDPAIEITFAGTGTADFTLVPTNLDFGDVPVGTTSASQTVTVTNTSGAPITLSSVAGGGAGDFGGATDCAGAVLAPGATCSFFYAFTPPAVGPQTANTSITLNGTNFSVDFTGNGVTGLTFAPTSLDFGSVDVGMTSASQTVTVTNPTGSTVTVTGMSGVDAGPFGGTTDCVGATLAPGGTCTITYAFVPVAGGPTAYGLLVTINGGDTALDFTGTGLGAGALAEGLLFEPTSLDFGDVEVGTTSPPQDVTVTNMSSAPITLSVAGGVAGVFGGVNNCVGATLDPGESCAFTYAFTPAALGATADSTSIGLSREKVGLSFTGTGVPFVDDPPVANADSYSTPAGTALTVAAPGVLANDDDPDGDALGAVLDTAPAHGTLSLGADGSFTYTPDAKFAGIDTFRYHVTAAGQSSNITSVTLTVTTSVDPAGPNDKPASLSGVASGTGDETLPYTGGGSGSPLWAGLGFLAAGVVVTRMTRRHGAGHAVDR